MRGGNRTRLRSEAGSGSRPPPPPRDLGRNEAALWRELALAVEDAGTYRPTDAVAFHRMVRCVYRAEVCPLDAAPSAAGRLEQAARNALEAFALTPSSRSRVRVEPHLRSPARRLLNEIEAEAAGEA